MSQSSPHRWPTMLALVIAGEAIFALPFVLPRIFRPTLLEVFGINNTELGVLFSTYGIVAMLSYFPGGPLADRVPARRMMAIALLSTAAGGLVYATLPSFTVLTGLYAWWGLTTILLFWAALLRATREWGGDDAQGAAYGLLDGGRGLVAALVASVSVAVFAWMMPDAEAATLEAKRAAFQSTVLYFTLGTAVAAGVVWLALPENPPPEDEDSGKGMDWAHIRRVVGMPTVWIQALIVVCAYVAYKGTDDFSLLASDALGYDDVQAASVGTMAFWIRPFAAVGAGLIADRVQGSRVLAVGFAALAVCNIAVAATAGQGIGWLLLGAIAATSVFVYSLRGVYFAIFDEGHVPLAVTGTAVGVVSVIGYTPDVFMGPLMGLILDRSPGVLGHQHLFLVMSGIAGIGCLATLGFRQVAARTG